MADLAWTEAEFHCHAFHYRTPETAAVLAINPGIPSPLTIKMALVGVLLQQGRRSDAETLAACLDRLQVTVRPPAAAVTFRAFMRYVRPPRAAGKVDQGSGSAYQISPHEREYALWGGSLLAYVGAPPDVAPLVEEALWDIPYLGAKDSMVTCLHVSRVPAPPPGCVVPLHPHDDVPKSGLIMQLVDMVKPAENLLQVIPGQRRARDYQVGPYLVPGSTRAEGSCRVYRRASRGTLKRWL